MLLSDISQEGQTKVLIHYEIPKENFETLKSITSIDQVLDLFQRKIFIGSPEDFRNKKQSQLVNQYSLHKLVPGVSALDKLQPGNILLYPITAFRYVNSGKTSNEETTANQFSKQVSSLLSESSGVIRNIQNEVDNSLTPRMADLQEKLARFAYPQNVTNPLKAVLTIDEWLNNPKIRISQLFEEADNFELPLAAQGLGYQNIYNIIARINGLFSRMKDLHLKNPVLLIIEEPEAFTHPQLQHVFIQQIRKYIGEQAQELGLSYQLVLISHSPEIAVSAFDMDFQIVIGRAHNGTTRFINWNSLGGENGSESREKLKKLMLNYNAELLFADKIIAFEGDSERLTLGALSRKLNSDVNILSEKIALIPVGTHFNSYQKALADLEFDRILLVTDIDFPIDWSGNFSKPFFSTNENIRYLLTNQPDIHMNRLSLNLIMSEKKEFLFKKWKLLRNGQLKEMKDTSTEEFSEFEIVSEGYQSKYNFWPRTLESAMVASGEQNCDFYRKNNVLRTNICKTLIDNPYELNNIEKKLISSKMSKTDFALLSLDIIPESDFTVPRYLQEGLKWLGEHNNEE